MCGRVYIREWVQSERELKEQLHRAEQRANVCPTLRLHADAKHQIKSAIHELLESLSR